MRSAVNERGKGRDFAFFATGFLTPSARLLAFRRLFSNTHIETDTKHKAIWTVDVLLPITLHEPSSRQKAGLKINSKDDR